MKAPRRVLAANKSFGLYCSTQLATAFLTPVAFGGFATG